MSQLLTAADVFCQPNVAPEPFGLVFVEALACGLPVVATRMGGAIEIIDDSCGRLVAARADAVADAVQELIVDHTLRRRLGAAGPARAHALCNPERQVQQLAHVLRSLVADTGTAT